MMFFFVLVVVGNEIISLKIKYEKFYIYEHF